MKRDFAKKQTELKTSVPNQVIFPSPYFRLLPALHANFTRSMNYHPKETFKRTRHLHRERKRRKWGPQDERPRDAMPQIEEKGKCFRATI
jgi:hypothetical protein